ncbi:transposase, partial [Thalassobacillus sp. CUG 92003]|uniref:transposase n=1 Tax=Thalassobacillus sp. CUG 92003 TaxID=2736641 RepID=UPI0015E6A468
RKKRIEDENILDLLIHKSVEVAQEQNVLHSSAIIVDSTHTRSRYNHVSAQEALRSHSKNLRKAVYSHDETMKKKMPSKPTEDTIEAEIEYTQNVMDVVENQSSLKTYPKVKESLNLLKEIVEDDLEHLQLSSDPDAKVGHKSADSSFFGYKTHLAMSEERIITAAATTTGEKSDGKYLTNLIEKSKQVGMNVDTVIGDAAYSERKNLIYANDHEMTLISRLNSSVTHGTRRKDQTFEFNKDAGMYVCPAGHMATHKRKDSRKASKDKSPRIRYYFDIEKCKTCPLKEGCYQEGANSKTYTVTIKSHEHQEQAEFQETEAFKEKAKERYKIEAKNSELKHRHGYEVASSSGLPAMDLQAAMAIFTVNMKRIVKLKEK